MQEVANNDTTDGPCVIKIHKFNIHGVSVAIWAKSAEKIMDFIYLFIYFNVGNVFF